MGGRFVCCCDAVLGRSYQPITQASPFYAKFQPSAPRRKMFVLGSEAVRPWVGGELTDRSDNWVR